MFKKMFLFIFNLIILCASAYLAISASTLSISQLSKALIITFVVVFFVLKYIFDFANKTMLSRLSYVLFILLSIGFSIYFILLKLNIISVFSSVSGLRDYILSTKEMGVFVYILIQATQVVFLPIPAAVICIAGSLIYGPFVGGVYCSIGVLIGSFLSFFIGKTCGYRVVSWVVGKDNCDKYSKIIRKRGSFFLGIAFLLPMFPDDILCLIAGITDMSWMSFAWVTILTRPIGVICMSYFGSGKLIPFTGWGIYVWCVILVLAVAMVYVTYRYQDTMQDFVLNKIFKRNKAKKSRKTNHKTSLI